MIEIAQALVYIHLMHVYHRDIKVLPHEDHKIRKTRDPYP